MDKSSPELKYSIIHTDSDSVKNYNANKHLRVLTRKYGIIAADNGNTNVVIFPIYDAIDRVDENYFKIKLNNKFGLIYRGKVVIDPVYDDYDKIIYLNKFLISFFPHISFCNFKVYFFWILFLICFLLLITIGFLWVYFKDFSKIFYISNIQKLLIKFYYLLVKTSSFPFSVFFFILWANFLKYSLIINSSIILVILISIDILLKFYFDKYYDGLRHNLDRLFNKSENNIFSNKTLLFREILYNLKGRKEFFLVKDFQGKWILVNRRLKKYRNYIFDEFIEEKDGVYIMKIDKEQYFVYINGRIPRINLRVV